MKGSPTYTEQELVSSLKQRTQAAFSYLYDNYAPTLNGVIMGILQDGEVSGDVLQEVFVKIWRQIEHYDPAKGRLFTWMYNIARTTSIDTLRSRDWKNSKRNHSLTEEYTLLADNSAQPADELGLRRTIQNLKADYKILVELSYFQGYTQEEIAGMLNIPLGTVKTRIRAAIVQLRQQVKL
ncbi:RNA polymerase sigma factor [Paraflavitalea speifideaquila]|uniref:RNA polymerase sigma factor n=1 Tax=Paraflavitalea speifideaquila TaxID=3076558 RepID=UPI0028E895D8|nr:sigma-70 family RNA polymerase sigma factor [Paraflavitalea speifideiaquila]